MPSPYPFNHFLTVPRDIPTASDATQWLAKRQGVLEDFQYVPAGEVCPLRAELSIPIDALIGRFTIESPLGLQGYRFEAIGTSVPHIIDALVAIARGQFFFELWLCSDAATVHTIPLAMWRRRVFCKGVPVFLEACWQPSHGESVTQKGLEHLTRVDVAKEVLSKGMKILKKLGRRGRRKGSYQYTDAELLKQLSQASELIKQDKGKVTNERLADVLGKHPVQISRDITRLQKAFGLPRDYFKT